MLVDTPGLHKPHDALGEELNRSALKALEDVDVVAMLVDATKPVGRGRRVGRRARRQDATPRSVLVLTKADLATERAGRRAARRGAQARRLRRRGRGLGDRRLQRRRVRRDGRALPAHGPALVPARHADRPVARGHDRRVHPREDPAHDARRGAARRRASRSTTSTYDDKKDLYAHLGDRSTSSAIRRRASSSARAGRCSRRSAPRRAWTSSGCSAAKVYLDLSVKVKKDWRRDATQIRRFGYGEGG